MRTNAIGGFQRVAVARREGGSRPDRFDVSMFRWFTGFATTKTTKTAMRTTITLAVTVRRFRVLPVVGVVASFPSKP